MLNVRLAIEHIRKPVKSNQSSKAHELECKLQNTRFNLQVVGYQVETLEQENKQLAALRDDLEKQLQEAKRSIKELEDGLNSRLETVGNSFSDNEVIQHQKLSFEQIDDGLVKKTPQLNSQSTEIFQQPVPRKLACPYYQRNPQKYVGRKACSGPGFESVSRLK
jgi:vacuolar-type H+-ATPase subunit D/Vma8